MVSRSKRVFGLIAKEAPGFVLCRDMLVIPPTEHILRGFLIEGTSEKNRIYLWKVVCPLHRPMQAPYLNYSHRITKDNSDIFIDTKAYKESATFVASIIREHVDDLACIRTPSDFLRHIERMKGSTDFNYRLDLALTHCRLTNFRKGRELLEDLRAAIDLWNEQMIQKFGQKRMQKYPDLLGDEVRQVTRMVKDDPKSLMASLDEWESRNVEFLELRPTRAPPVDQ